MQIGAMRYTRRWLAAAMFMLFFLPGVAQAQCSFSVSDLDFGLVNLFTTAQPTSTATVSITCSNPNVTSLSYRVCLNIGAGTGATGTTRRMQNGSNYLQYQLSSSSSYTPSWGARTQTGFGGPVQVDVLVLPGIPTTVTRTIYGRLAASQSSAAGGQYVSSFAGVDATFNWQPLDILTSCSAISQNPTVTPFAVRAQVDRSCVVSSQSIDFGSRTTLGTALNATGSLSVTCSSSLPYTISMSNGLWGTGPTQRLMRLQATTTGPTIAYGLYRNSTRTQIWGSTTGQTAGNTGSGIAQVYPIYARLEPQTTPHVGVYLDTVVVTVTY